MVMQKGKSGLLSKYGATADKAVAAHATAPIDWGQQRVPPGISNGIAQLEEIGFKVSENQNYKGEIYFQARARIMEPESVTINGQEARCRGLVTSVVRMVCNTKTKAGKVTTVEDHLAEITNDVKMIANDEDFLNDCSSASDLEDKVALLQAMAKDPSTPIYIRFSTSQSAPTAEFPDPRVWENWYGSKGLEDYVPPEESSIQDDTASPPSKNGPAPTRLKGPLPEVAKTPPAKSNTLPVKSATNGPAKAVPAPKPAVGRAMTRREPEPELEETPATFDEFSDLDSLAKKADEEGDDEAAKQIQRAALTAGFTKEQIQDPEMTSWAAVVEMIRTAEATGAVDQTEEPTAEPESEDTTGEDGEDGEPPDTDNDTEAVPPNVGNGFKYQPVGPTGKPVVGKDKKPVKPVLCQVTAVQSKSRTVTLTTMGKPTVVYKGVSWADLLEA